MTKTEFTSLVDRIEALWPGSEWVTTRGVSLVYDQFRHVDVDAAVEAVEMAFREGYDWPPKPSRLLASALNVQRRLREVRALSSEVDGPPVSAQEFAEAHGGLLPSQVARQIAGLTTNIGRQIPEDT